MRRHRSLTVTPAGPSPRMVSTGASTSSTAAYTARTICRIFLLRATRISRWVGRGGSAGFELQGLDCPPGGRARGEHDVTGALLGETVAVTTQAGKRWL